MTFGNTKFICVKTVGGRAVGRNPAAAGGGRGRRRRAGRRSRSAGRGGNPVRRRSAARRRLPRPPSRPDRRRLRAPQSPRQCGAAGRSGRRFDHPKVIKSSPFTTRRRPPSRPPPSGVEGSTPGGRDPSWNRFAVGGGAYGNRTRFLQNQNLALYLSELTPPGGGRTRDRGTRTSRPRGNAKPAAATLKSPRTGRPRGAGGPPDRRSPAVRNTTRPAAAGFAARHRSRANLAVP